MIIQDILEGVHGIIRVCKHRSIRMHVYMHVCSKGTDVNVNVNVNNLLAMSI